MKRNEKFNSRGFLTTSQVADVCGVNRATVVRWIQHGDLIAERTIGGRYRICSENLLILSKQKGIFIAPDMRELLTKNNPSKAFGDQVDPDIEDDKEQITKTHILVIDDDQQFRSLIDEFLTIYGYKVSLAENGFSRVGYRIERLYSQAGHTRSTNAGNKWA